MIRLKSFTGAFDEAGRIMNTLQKKRKIIIK
jgi:hypothetical protein